MESGWIIVTNTKPLSYLIEIQNDLPLWTTDPEKLSLFNLWEAQYLVRKLTVIGFLSFIGQYTRV